MKTEFQMYINGEWTDASDAAVFEDYNPYTGQVYARITSANQNDAKRAIDAAQEAFPQWAATPPSEKRLFLLKAADSIEKRQEEIARILSEETGSAISFARYQTKLAPNYFREAASQVHRVTGKVIPADIEGSLSMVLRQPVGVVVGISPWNAPVALSLKAICYPIAYGNTVVLKPSAESPISGGIVMAQIFEEAGFPRGVLNVVTNGPGRTKEVGNEFLTDKRVKRINFTGSTEVGRKLAEQAGRYLKKMSLELGGSDPLIILKDADMDYAVNAAVFGRFIHQGQVCMSAKRIIIEEPVISEFTEKFIKKVSGLKVGDPLNPDTIIGPLINQQQLEELKAQVEKSVADGATLLCGGKHEGLCYYPTVLGNVTEEMAVFQEETFGPVAPLIAVKDSEDALRAANNTDFGLSSGIITGDVQKGLEMAERLEAGMTHINDSPVHSETHAPSGGIKDSGWGRSGMEAIEESTELHWVTIQKTKRQFPF